MEPEDNNGLEGPEAEPPRGLLRRLARAARQNPLAELAQEQLQKVESRVLGGLRARMDKLGAAGSGSVSLSGSQMVAAFTASVGGGAAQRNPAAVLSELLTISQEQSNEQAKEMLLAATLKLITPDEARILAAFSDGSVHPLIHVVQASVLGTGQMVSENASTVGRAAGVKLPARTPLYITRLRALGLVDFGPEDVGLAAKYEMLTTDASVMDAIVLTEDKHHAKAKIQRRTVMLSAFGRELWEYCHRPYTVSNAGGNAVSERQ